MRVKDVSRKAVDVLNRIRRNVIADSRELGVPLKDMIVVFVFA